jgi:predicted DNA-binding transcriptional regulator AlpA
VIVSSFLTEQAREAIRAAGGLASVGDLAERWSLSRQRVHRLANEASFPEPVWRVSGHRVWLVSDADAWQYDRVGHRLRARLGGL